MDRETSPTSSTPSVFRTLTEEDHQDSLRQVPSPLVESDLTNCSQSTILETSLSGLSMETHGDSPMDMVTSTETTVMEVGWETPESTPIARKTRSHDGVKPCLQKVDTPNPKQILDNLMKHINSEIQVAKEKNAEKTENTQDQPAIKDSEADDSSDEEISDSSIEVEDTLKSYTVVPPTEKGRETPDKEFTLVDLEENEEEEKER